MKRPAALVYDPQRGCWLSFATPTRVLSSHTVSDVRSIVHEAQEASDQSGVWSVGWVSYEAAPAFDSSLHVRAGRDIPLVWFGQYEEPTILSELPAPDRAESLSWQAGMSRDEYGEAFAAVHQHIARGDTYQVNLSFRMATQGITDAYSLFHSMVAHQAGRYSFFIDAGRFAVCSASPELFFELSDSSIVCRPMKGTAKRVASGSADQAQGAKLSSSEKERAENVMIVDMVRNDLSRIAADGSVRVTSLFEVEKFPGVLQMVSEVRAVTTAPIVDILSATFPSASITGAPKQSTMEIIKRVENSPRGIYTGSLGIITPQRRSWFNVAIRTAVVDQLASCAEYGVGSGVVWDSQETSEYNECILKSHVVGPARTQQGLFETLLWDGVNGYRLLDLHIDRLCRSARCLGYRYDVEQAHDQLLEAVKPFEIGGGALRVKLVLGPLGTMRTEVGPIAALPKPYRLALARQSVLSTDPRLFHKIVDRTVYDTAIPVVPNVDDVLLWNERGEITESRIANVLVRLEGTLYTPPLSSGLLPGCQRQWLLEAGKIEERIITVEDLKRSESVYLVNSLRGMWAVEVLLEGDARDDRTWQGAGSPIP